MTDLTITLEGTLKPHHAPLFFALEGGLFEGRDLSVDWQVTDPGKTSLTAMLDGDSEVAITRPLNLVSEFLRGNDVVGIVRFFHTDSGVLFRSDSNLESPSDLAEAPILCSDVGPELARTVLSVMADGEVSGEEFSLDVPAKDPVEVFYEGDHEALITAGVNPEGVQMEDVDFDVDFWFYDDHDIPANGDLVVATTSEIADGQPKLMQNFVHSLHDSVNVLDNDADRGRDLIREEYEECLEVPGGEPLLFTSFSELTTNFSQDFQTYTAWGDFLTEHGEIGGFVDVDRLIDERFIPLDSMTF